MPFVLELFNDNFLLLVVITDNRNFRHFLNILPITGTFQLIHIV